MQVISSQHFNGPIADRLETCDSHVPEQTAHLSHRRRKPQLSSRQDITANSCTGAIVANRVAGDLSRRTIECSVVISYLYALVIGALTSWPAHTQGQRFASHSSDLASVRGERVRVIVQSDERGLNNLASKHRFGFRRRLATSVALDVDKHELDALKRDSSVLHISRDLPVAADMAITNKVTRADAVWKGTSGLLGLFGTPGYNGSGIGVAVLDSGIAPHSAMGSRVIARVNFVASEPWRRR